MINEIIEKDSVSVADSDISVKESAKVRCCPNEISKKTIRKKVYMIIKRTVDVIVALSAGIILCIPMLVLAGLIRLESPGPALFQQTRMGRGGLPFTIYKFRSMRIDAPSDMPTNDFSNLEVYATKLGQFMRKTSLDELPQLINVLKGDMSLVGYRPVCLTEEELNRMRLESGVFTTRPGITGYAQVLGRDKVSREEKARLDAYYVKNCSLRLDIWCIFKTISVVITQEGAK